ncbi:sugar ABC transporter [Nocardioides szechwanensis]|uniref:Monosaccharide ABC transporter ATP-binding protein, CUT2 family n=1 Tax=Nocardioides szechwanensis TaxID=1005944 RepID=A0A1G9ZMC8_9ACTN|nr:sugar ABC transporter ATP-binding protein [Nocardioides szechwanensis]GEP33981.1 sugar ABC transporter [Nocardioides szechwanensis]SDN22297.1 monosaccharide ABC transporter ATP-binding protein, CUT2 family [Nocardioides szechwanensis]
MTTVPALEVRDLVKGFGGVPVLRGLSFELRAGRVVALVGENGAGKSTAMKIATGQLRADSGQVYVAGELLSQPDPMQLRKLGVTIIPQELAPYPDLTVYENLFVGRELRTRLGTLDRREMVAEARKMLAVFDVDIDPHLRMGRMSVALTQIVEIAKATTWGAKVLFLDEPSSSIPEREVARLHAVVRKLRDHGVAMLYTTHRMEEIKALADQIVVLRDGQLVMDVPIDDATEDEIVKAMIGRELGTLFPRTAPVLPEVAYEVRGLRLSRNGPQVDLSVRRGEILGLGGLVGAGRTEIVEAMFGIRRSVEGNVELDGKRVPRNAPAAAIRAGVAFVPEDRKGAGLVLTRSILDNGSLPHLRSFTTAGWLLPRRRKAVEEATKAVSVRCRSIDQLVGTLSGGNQQKVVLSRWLIHNTKVLLLDEPTRGVDVGARGEIYDIIRDLASSGLAVILVSSDMPELIGLTHRVLVVRAGAAVAELSREELDREDAPERIFRLASGQTDLGGVPQSARTKESQ